MNEISFTAFLTPELQWVATTLIVIMPIFFAITFIVPNKYSRTKIMFWFTASVLTLIILGIPDWMNVKLSAYWQ